MFLYTMASSGSVGSAASSSTLSFSRKPAGTPSKGVSLAKKRRAAAAAKITKVVRLHRVMACLVCKGWWRKEGGRKGGLLNSVYNWLEI